jgi:hypothetical protein
MTKQTWHFFVGSSEWSASVRAGDPRPLLEQVDETGAAFPIESANYTGQGVVRGGRRLLVHLTRAEGIALQRALTDWLSQHDINPT